MNEIFRQSQYFNTEQDVRSLLSGKDWQASPLGHPGRWPPQLAAAVNLLLDSTFPMFVAWGKELVVIYNDAYARILGGKHPHSFGSPLQTIWPEIWPDIHSIVDDALAGKPTYVEDLPLTVLRNGYAEQAWFTFSSSPIRDGNGMASGLYCTVVETTGRVVAEKRHAFQLELADRIRSLRSPQDIISTASDMLGRHLGVSRVYYAEVDDDSRTFHIQGKWSSSALPSLPDTGRIDSYGAATFDALRSGQAFVVSDVATDQRTADSAAAYTVLGIRALLVISLVKEGRLAITLNLTKPTPYQWTQEDILVVEDVAERTWAAVERARAEVQLRIERDRSQYIFDSMNEGFAMLDRDWTFVTVNAEAARILQHSKEELLGHNHWQAVPETAGTPLQAFYLQVRESNNAGTLEYFHTLPDGRQAWVELHAYPLRDDALAIFLRDITERKEAEKRLQETAHRLQFILDSAQIGEWDLDLRNDTSYRSLKHDQCFGYQAPVADWGFEKFIRHVHPEDREFVSQQFRNALAELKGWHFECRVVWPDRSIHWIAAHGSIYEADPKPVKMGGIVFDITERKQAEEELRKADRRKDEFLAMLAHELRNPLAPISAAAELMEMVKLDEARLRQTSQVITRQVRHMTGLVDDLLDVSRVTRGRVTINRQPQDLKSIVSNAIEQVRPLIESQRHHLVLDLAPESAQVLGDQKRLVQILTNLLNNAAKYTPQGGNIALRMEVEESQVILRVRDNGIGIAHELQSHVFELFAQAERTSDRSQGGLGLGLALVKSLTELHGGKVTCYSEGQGKGSEFTVYLPRLMEQRTPLERRQTSRSIRAAERRLKVLVVDDNADAARMLALLLEASGHEVLVEHGSRRALERARIDAPDVCVLDIGLPDIDGNELARQLRAQPETAGAVLIAVTGYGQEQDRKNAMDAGFDHHLVKPVDAAKLTVLLPALRRA